MRRGKTPPPAPVEVRVAVEAIPVSVTSRIEAPRESRDYRRELWVGVAIAVASSSNAAHMISMAAWADEALDAFDRRFPR